MKNIVRVCSAGALAAALVSATAALPAYASTEAVSGAGMLAAPSGLTPDDSGAPYPHLARKNVTLDWAPVSGATGYRVQVGRDSTWSDSPVLTQDVKISEFTLPILLPHATYVWRVAALAGTSVGHWSSEEGRPQSEAEFTKGWRAAPTPVPVSPGFKGRPTYAWSPVADASGYELQVSSDPLFPGTATGPTPDTSPAPGQTSQPPAVLGECFTARTRVTPAKDIVGESGTVGECNFVVPSPGSTVYWRVRALDGAATASVAGSTTPESQAGISYLPPSGDEIEPVDKPCGETTDFGCEPSNPSVAGAWSAVQSYVYTAATPAGAAMTTVPTTSLASDPDGLCTVTNAGATEAEHALCRDVPTLRWPEVDGAVRYRISLSLDDDFSNIQHVVETSGLQWTPNGSWFDASAGTSYYYVVQACDLSSCGRVTSTAPSFSKVTPRLTSLTSPGVSGEMRFTWNSYATALSAATGQAATQDAFDYHVQVAPSDHPSYDVVADEAYVDELFYAPQKAYADGSYVWRVQAVDSGGHKLPWSTSRSFTRDATAPKVTSVSPSSDVAVTSPLKLVFSEPVTGVSSSTVTLSPAATTTVTVTGPTTATLTPTKALVPGATYRVVLSSAVKDLSGNGADPLGPTLAVKALVNDTSKAFTYGGTWKAFASSSAIGGGYRGSSPTSTAKTSATTKLYGVGAAVYACMGPASGYLDVYVDGVKKARVSLYRSYSGCGIKVATIGSLARSTHTLKLVGIGAKVSASKGTNVSVDAVKALA